MPVCKKCGDNFSPRIKENGSWKYLSKGRKYCLTCSPYKLHNTQKLEGKEYRSMKGVSCVCSVCKRVYLYDRSKGHTEVKCNSCWNRLRRKEVKKGLVEHKGSKCCACGYAGCIEALTFHHMDPSKKEISIANSFSLSSRVLEKEIDKCVLICARCHIEFHSGYIDESTFKVDSNLKSL